MPEFAKVDPAEAEIAQDDAGEKLSENGRLAQAHRDLPGDPPRGEDDGEREDDLGDRAAV